MRLLDRFLQDLTYAGRTLPKHPVVGLIIVLSLALGIGATSSVFSVADALLLRPLPVPRGDEIVTIIGQGHDAVSYSDYRDLRDQNKSFRSLSAYIYVRLGVAQEHRKLPRIRQGVAVSANYFRTLETPPALGRAFTDEEDKIEGRNPVAMLSYRAWQIDFASDPKVIGQTVRINDIDFNIVGVANEALIGMDPFLHPDLYVPASMLPKLASWAEHTITERNSRSFLLKGRLKPGVVQSVANAELTAFSKRLDHDFPNPISKRAFTARTEIQNREHFSPQNLALSAMMLGIAALVLMAACANVASLLLGRAEARSREISVRIAIGAGRKRVIQQLLTESLLLALIGCVLGLVLAKLWVNYLAATVSFQTELPIYLLFQLDRRVLVFSLIATVLSTLLFGLAPAIRSAQVDLIPALKNGETGGGRSRSLARKVLVIAQVGVTLMLLCGEALFIRTFQSTFTASPGYRTDHLAMLSFDPSIVRSTPEQNNQFYSKLLQQARLLPGVNHAALTQMIPTEYTVPSVNVFPEGSESQPAYTYTVSDQYFETMDTHILQGRGFAPTDDANSRLVAVVNQTFAANLWPNADPIGKRFRIGDRNAPLLEVVGVAQTTWYRHVAEDHIPFFYRAMAQDPKWGMSLLVETSFPNSADILPQLRGIAASIDPRQPVFNLRNMHDYYYGMSLQSLRIVIQLVGIMGALGLSLALIGLYALMSYSVSRRKREIGIRMAIGAAHGQILRLILREGAVLALLGLGIGYLGSIGLLRTIRAVFSRLQDSNFFDPWTLVFVPLALLIVTLAASYIPARHAAAIDPNTALRYE